MTAGHLLSFALGWLFGVLFVGGVSAQELTYNTSGFATYTYVQDRDWFPSRGTVALNGAVHYDAWALKAQVSDNEVHVRRAVVEYSNGINGHNGIIQIGRIPRLNTIYSDVYGNPSEWDLAILPMSTYNRRKVHSLAFNALDGVKAIYDHNANWGGVRAIIDYGKGIQEHDCEWQQEATRKPCMNGWDFDGKEGAFDASLEARIGAEWTVMASYSSVLLGTRLIDPRDRTAIYFTTRLVKDLDYRFGRLSLRYSGEHGYIQTEHGESRLWFKQPGGWKLDSTAWDDYYMGGWYVTDELTAIGGYAIGHQRGSPITSRDAFVGAVYRDGRWSHTVEFHHGQGSWQRHGSWHPEWHSLVASTTYSW